MFHHAAEVYAKYTICACKLIALIYLVAPRWGCHFMSGIPGPFTWHPQEMPTTLSPFDKKERCGLRGQAILKSTISSWTDTAGA